MARIADRKLEDVPADAQAVWRAIVDRYGPFQSQLAIVAHRPPALRHVYGLLLELADDALVSKRDLEIALVTVSRLNECHYCVGHHAPRLVAQGLSAEAVDRILDAEPPGFTARDRLVRDWAVEVTLRPGRIPERLFRALRQEFDEAQIVELTLRTALCGFFNRFNDALGIEPEGAHAEAPADAA